MRSDAKHLAKCGKESLYYCQTHKTTCGHIWPNCRYKPHTITSRKDHNEIHPIANELSRLFANALAAGLPNTAWCIDLAMTAIGWEVQTEDYHSQPLTKDVRDILVMNKLRQKIERDKGIKVR